MTLAKHQIDHLKTTIDLGLAQAAEVLNEVLESKVDVDAPAIRLVSPSDLIANSQSDGLATVMLAFSGKIHGTSALAFPIENAIKLVTVLTGEEPDSADFDELKVEALREVGNIVLNGAIGAISNALDQQVIYRVPVYAEETLDMLMLRQNPTSAVNMVALAVQTRFEVEQLALAGNILLFFEADAYDALIAAIEVVTI